jgi:glyoxylase-like metal-dependent hydrolase (beta-lactamase superfamily II)/rhodanese-related sulfurtransferase
MAKTIDSMVLRRWLEDKIPVFVLDVRPQDQRDEWAIPSSYHFDIYEKLKQHKADALDGVIIPENTPVVTVCAAGKTSEIAADLLIGKGYEVYSLEGGMKGWSLSWNTATLRAGGITIVQVRRTGKGCLSYLIASKEEAVVIDASVDIEVYATIAAQNNWKIKYVLDTHVHADHFSRTPDLARRTAAKMYFPQNDKLQFHFDKLVNGDQLTFGGSTLKAFHTPGHTLESTSFLVDDIYLFTGDTLFVDGVGRPDLKADEDQTKVRASLLYASLHKILELSKETMIFPGHVSKPVPFDDVLITRSLGELAKSVRSLKLNKQDFISSIISRIPPTPPNYLQVSEINIRGIVGGVDLRELEAGANRCAIS